MAPMDPKVPMGLKDLKVPLDLLLLMLDPKGP